jgi:hypothetical protein
MTKTAPYEAQSPVNVSGYNNRQSDAVTGPSGTSTGNSENGHTGKKRRQAVNHQFWANVGKIRYGLVILTAKIHDGRVVDISHTTSESTRDGAWRADE